MIDQRKKLGYTQKEVALNIGKSRSTYGMYELGVCTPPFEIVLKLKILFKYHKDDLLDNDNYS
jgi:DNA-binding XRE family transcriptional regulator